MAETTYTVTTTTNSVRAGAINPRYVTGQDGRQYVTYFWECYKVCTACNDPVQENGDNVLHAIGDGD